MKSRIRTHKKRTREQTQEFSTAPAQPMFQSRPFVVQTQQAEQSQQPDLKTALRQAERYGHHLNRLQSVGVSSPPTKQLIQRKEMTASGATPVQMMRKLDAKDVEGYKETHKTILQGLEANKLNPDKTLVVSVGRSPQVLTTYLKRQNMSIIDLPMSGLSGKEMTDYEDLNQQKKDNRDNFFKTFIEDNLKGKEAILTIDIGVSGSSNFGAYQEIKNYLKRKNIGGITVKMATISPFQNKPREGFDTEKVQHDDNIFKKNPLNDKNRGIHRLLKVQYNSIDKDMTYTDKFRYTKIDTGEEVPEVDKQKRKELEAIVDEAIAKYGADPFVLPRKNPDKAFQARLLFEHEVKKWKEKQNERQTKGEDRATHRINPKVDYSLKGLMKIVGALLAEKLH